MLRKIFYIICIILGITVVILNCLDLMNVIKWEGLSKLTTVLLNIELILICCGIWKHNKIVGTIGIVLALVLIVVTLI